MNNTAKNNSVRVLRDDSINKNHEKKERSTENKGVSKEDPTKKTPKENTKTSSINWEEEKEIIKQFLHQEYPLTTKKIDKIIKDKKEKYIDINKYKTFFLKLQAEKLMKNIKKSRKLSKASEDVKSYFDTEAKEESHTKNKMNDISEDDDDDDEEEEEEESSIDESKTISYSDDEDSNDEGHNENILNSNVLRKRKCEFSTLDDGVPKKKEGLSLRWFRNGNKVCMVIYIYIYIYIIL